MLTHMGEYLVGSYLKLIEGCDVVDYNVRPPGGGLKGLGELDVIGLNFKTNTAYFCEVTTHITGLLYVNNKETVDRINRKHKRQQEYAKEYRDNFKNHRFMFWSPRVSRGYITENLTKTETLELVINGDYGLKVNELRTLAKTYTHDTQNPFFRTLQILEHMNEWPVE